MSALDFLKYLAPPKEGKNATPWRWAIFVTVLILVGDGVSGRGFLGGYGAYAAAADVQIILELQYAEVIRDLHRQICGIKPDRNTILEGVLDDYQQRYDDLTGQRYPLPSCFRYPDE